MSENSETITYVIIGFIIGIALGILIYYCIEQRRKRKKQMQENRNTQYGIVPRASYVDGTPLSGDEILSQDQDKAYANQIIRQSWFQNGQNYIATQHSHRTEDGSIVPIMRASQDSLPYVQKASSMMEQRHLQTLDQLSKSEAGIRKARAEDSFLITSEEGKNH